MARPFFIGDEFDFAGFGASILVGSPNKVSVNGTKIKPISEGTTTVMVFNELGELVEKFNVTIIEPSRPPEYKSGMGKRIRNLRITNRLTGIPAIMTIVKLVGQVSLEEQVTVNILMNVAKPVIANHIETVRSAFPANDRGVMSDGLTVMKRTSSGWAKSAIAANVLAEAYSAAKVVWYDQEPLQHRVPDPADVIGGTLSEITYSAPYYTFNFTPESTSDGYEFIAYGHSGVSNWHWSGASVITYPGRLVTVYRRKWDSSINGYKVELLASVYTNPGVKPDINQDSNAFFNTMIASQTFSNKFNQELYDKLTVAGAIVGGESDDPGAFFLWQKPGTTGQDAADWEISAVSPEDRGDNGIGNDVTLTMEPMSLEVIGNPIPAGGSGYKYIIRMHLGDTSLLTAGDYAYISKTVGGDQASPSVYQYQLTRNYIDIEIYHPTMDPFEIKGRVTSQLGVIRNQTAPIMVNQPTETTTTTQAPLGDLVASFDGSNAQPEGWTIGGTGTLETDGSKIYASSYGSNAGKYAGPSLEKTFDPIADFDLEVDIEWNVPGSTQYHIMNISLLDNANYKVAEIYLVRDSNGVSLGFYFQNRQGQIGSTVSLGYIQGKLRITRKGNTISAYRDNSLVSLVETTQPNVSKVRVDIQQYDVYGGGTLKIDNLVLYGS